LSRFRGKPGLHVVDLPVELGEFSDDRVVLTPRRFPGPLLEDHELGLP
jgi:hypothetical protein